VPLFFGFFARRVSLQSERTRPTVYSLSGDSTLSEQKAQLTWTVHPVMERSRIKQTIGAIVLIVLFCAIVYFSTPSGWGWTIFSAVILVLALNRFFFRSRFVIDEEGITARHPLRRRRFLWKNIRRFQVDRYGGYLSTRSGVSRLDAYRGMHLLFNVDRDEIIEMIRERIDGADAEHESDQMETESSGDVS